MAIEKYIPIHEESDNAAETGACAAKEPYALMVLGDSMEPEFSEGEVIIIDPEGLARDGSYVVAFHNEEYIFRQIIEEQGNWYLNPLNTGYDREPIPGLECVHGVIVQKRSLGRRKGSTFYK